MRTTFRRGTALAVAAVLATAGWLGVTTPASAEETPLGHVTLSMDVHTLGAGYLYEPAIVPFYEGETYADVTDRLLGGDDHYHYSGELDAGFYLSAVELPRSIDVDVPEIILDALGDLDSGPSEAGEYLGEFGYSPWSGWMYSVNGELPNVGVSDREPADGDVVRWHFTVYGYGADLGLPDSGWGTTPLYTAADKDALLTAVATVNSADDKAELLAKPGAAAAYAEAYEVLADLTASQTTVDEATAALTDAISATTGPGEVTPTPPSKVDISAALSATMARMVESVPSPAFGTSAGEWTVLTLARAGYAVPAGYFDGYYDRVAAHVTDSSTFASTPKLHNSKSTENSRLIMALSALGKDATNVGGLDFTAPLSDLSFVRKQGINGPIFALIALDTRGYEVPSLAVYNPSADPANQTTRQALIDFILSKELTETGGWALSGSTPDPDITAMALQALTPYRDQPAVGVAIDRALTVLSGLQLPAGGFSSWGTVNAESIAQVIVALTGLGIDPATDSRFVKPEGNAVSALLEFADPDGGFRHVLAGAVDGMATDQGGYALVAYDRFVNGRNSLYAMGDAGGDGPAEPEPTGPAITITGPDQVTSAAGTEFAATVRATAWPEGELKLIDGLLTVPAEFTVVDVTPGARLQGGSLTWHLDPADRKLRFVYTNTELSGVSLTGTDFPADLFSVKLAVAEGVDPVATPTVSLNVGGVTAKTGSADPVLVFDVTTAIHTVALTAPIEVGLTVRELFTGDGIDLIPADKRAVAIGISGHPEGTVAYYEDTALVLSPELTAKAGLPTYVLVTTPQEPAEELADPASYRFETGTAATLRFGDTDANQVINAQDALDVIAAWLRKSPVTTDQQILVHNVTSDARINTADALALMEHYVSGTELAVTTR